MGDAGSTRRDNGDDDGGGPSVGDVPGLETRLRAAEIVALKLGELLEELLEELRGLPRWLPAVGRRRQIERAIEVGLTLFHAWQDAYDPDAA